MSKEGLRPFSIGEVPAPPEELKARVEQFLKRHSLALNVEIGCGVGFHPIHYAKQHPNESILAIERTAEKYSKFESRLNAHNLPNLLGVHSEAAILLPHTLSPKMVDQYFILYPNPYPKESQKNLRWAYSPFLNFILESLKPKGKLLFATNIDSYKDELCERLPKLFQLETVYCEAVTESEHPLSHFEKKYLERGETCWHMQFQLLS